MRENGTTSETSISNRIKQLFLKIYWEQIVIPINYLIYIIKFSILKVNMRSKETLNSHSSNRLDTNEQMQIIKKGQDDMIEFLNTVPDECIVELSHRWYCNAKSY